MELETEFGEPFLQTAAPFSQKIYLGRSTDPDELTTRPVKDSAWD
jgi:hypothetical protein